MKKLLLLSLLIALTFQINGQQLMDLEDRHQTLSQESEQLIKDRRANSREVLKVDSTYRYDDTINNLQRKWMYFDYNTANNYTYYHDYDYEGNMEWSPNFIRNRTFNLDGSVNSYTSQRFVDGEWINSSKADFEYNSSGYETLEHREGWDTDLEEWIPFVRFERTYNDDNTLLTLKHYSKDLSSNELELSYIITYNNVDNVITDWLWERYNDGSIYQTSKIEVFFDANNDRDSTVTYDFNEYNYTWEKVSRYVYPEDISAPVRTYQTEQYNAMTASWDPQFRSIYTDFADKDQLQYWDRFRSDEGDPEFYLNSRLEYFVSDNPLLDVEATTLNEIDINLANPFTGNPQITVDGINEHTTFLIYDINGIIVFKKELNQSESFSLNRILPNGNYFINLVQDNKVVQAKKILKLE